MGLRDILKASGIGSVAAAIGDVVLYGGDQLVELVFFVVATIDLWLPFASRLASVARVVDWLPEDALQRLVVVFAAIAAVVYLVRILKRWRQRQ